MKKATLLSLLPVFLLLLSSCGNQSNKYQVQKSALDELIKKTPHNNFSIVLLDMDYIEDKDELKHQYQIIYQPNSNSDTLVSETKEWLTVSAVFFEKHQEDMGMAIASKKDGILDKKTAPSGYNNYIGNEKYGQWEKRSNGSSFWSFYGKYMFMSSMFNLALMPARYSYWNDYRSNYYPHGTSYYGRYNGNSSYGTNSAHTRSSNSNSRWQNKSSSFKQKVRNNVKASKSRLNRSSNRYSNSGSMRSRGGGFGK
jgi:hypothetical protein